MKSLYEKLRRLIRGKLSLWVHNEVTIDLYKKLALNAQDMGISNDKVTDEPLIVSLTTYSKRIHEVYLVIESIMQQTILPNKIILWLDEAEFNDETIPLTLKRQIKRGLTIAYCKNLKSYKKIIPTLIAYPDSSIITIDDDVIYPHDFIERMVVEYRKDKNLIYYYRGREMSFKRGTAVSYSKWPLVKLSKPLFHVIPTGVGGVLYPNGCFDERVLNEDLWTQLCPKADDVWLRAMTMLKGFKCSKIEISGSYDYNFVSLENNQDIALTNTNVSENQNDIQIDSIFKYFDLYKVIESYF